MSSTAEVWFPLSKSTCLLIRHDADKMKRLDALLDAGKMKEAKAVGAELPPIVGGDVLMPALVDAVNEQTIENADRFVYSPFESEKIPQLFKGESQNIRLVTSSPFKKKERK
jgi:hypothetical protein